MTWPTREITSWDEFAGVAKALALGPHDASYLLRGQADAHWDLKPSLLRYFGSDVDAETVLRVESLGRADFESQAHLHLDAGIAPPSRPTSSHAIWWALMQHHSAPTRLLDWTLSAYVAAYFAVERELDKPGAIFLARHRTILEHKSKLFAHEAIQNHHLDDAASPRALMVWKPERATARHVAQQGYFTFGINVLTDQNAAILEASAEAAARGPGTLYCQKWIIPAGLKLEFLRHLRRMNIAAHSLFPGIDGVGRSLSEAARLAARA
jgi:hypothetical protein